jgi:hypothetical protein
MLPSAHKPSHHAYLYVRVLEGISVELEKVIVLAYMFGLMFGFL